MFGTYKGSNACLPDIHNLDPSQIKPRVAVEVRAPSRQLRWGCNFAGLPGGCVGVSKPAKRAGNGTFPHHLLANVLSRLIFGV